MKRINQTKNRNSKVEITAALARTLLTIMPVREAARLAGIAKSTLWDAARRVRK